MEGGAGSGADNADFGLGPLLEVHKIDPTAFAERGRRRGIRRLVTLLVLAAIVLCVGFISMLTEKDSPADHAVRVQALMLMAGLLAGCVLLIGLVMWLEAGARKAMAGSHISVFENGIVLTRAGRWGGVKNHICPWNEIADLRQRSVGPLLLGLKLIRSDGSTLFLENSFDSLLQIEERFHAMRSGATAAT